MTRDEWQRAEPLLTRALLLPDREREALLQTVDLEDALRRDILAMFRRSLAGSASVAVAGHLPTPPAAVPTALPALPVLPPGSTLANGRYVVVRQIGRGGMGAVFLGHDTTFGTLVALKAVPYDERLLAEARRAAVCSDHPHVATIHNVLQERIGEQDVGVLVMEYVAGTPASQLLDDGPVDVARVVKWGRQIAAAVAHAHDHQVLHCDLKPANIVITSDGRATVLDFGISRATFDSGDSKEPVRGTMPYMAPEQILSKQFLPAGDIYSLGVTLFELLTGRLPFEGDDDVLRLRIVGAPPPDASELVADVPPDLQRVLERALAKEPEKRFRSARSFERALAAVEQGVEHHTTTTVPVPTSMPPPPVQWPVKVAGATAVFAMMVTFIGFVSSRALDTGLGRSGDFRVETSLSWPVWGLMSLTMPMVVLIAVAAAYVLLAGVCRLAFSFGPVKVHCAPITRILQRAIRRVVEGAVALPHALVLLQVATLGAILAYFAPVIEAIYAFMGHSAGSLEALRPGNVDTYSMFRLMLSVHLLLFGGAWWHLWRNTARSSGAGRVGGAVVLVTLFFFAVPFRVLHHNDHRRVTYASQICYLTAQRGDDVLVFCPRLTPRTRIVSAQEGSLIRSNVVEDIFSEFDRTAP